MFLFNLSMRHYQISLLLVVLQVTGISYLLLTSPVFPINTFLWIIWGISVALGAWSFISMHPNKFYIFPEVKSGNILVTHGPYAYIRHPMNLSLLLYLGSLVTQTPTVERISVFVALTLVILVKIRYEEKFLTKHYPGYTSYTKKTSRLIPFLY